MFICLANKDAETVPTRPEKSELNDAGLEEQKIVFSNKNGSFAHVRSTLEKVVPKMKDLDGRFEILKTTSAQRFLSAIPIPPLGYIVPVLKDGLDHATAYIENNIDVMRMRTYSASTLLNLFTIGKWYSQFMNADTTNKILRVFPSRYHRQITVSYVSGRFY